MRVLVCGGRTYSDRRTLASTLDKLTPKPALIIAGAAPGADTLAAEWAVSRCVESAAFYADWELHGKAAGPMRNRRMLEEGKPDLVVAFPGGSGTADMVRQAKAAGVRVLEVRPPRREASATPNHPHPKAQ